MNHEFNLAIKICEKLPFDWTLFAINGRCQKIDDYCPNQICNNSNDLIICRKKTTTTIPLTGDLI